MEVNLLAQNRNPNQGYSVNVTPVYYWNYNKYKAGKYRLIINQGSSRSSKNYSIIQCLITIALQQKKHITITSRTMVHLRSGALFDFEKIMRDWGVWRENSYNKSFHIYTFPNGSIIEFFGCDDESKVHGPGRDILYINEAIFVDYGVYKQFALRTRDVVFLDYNPCLLESWVYDVHTDKTIPSCRLISTYKQALPFLTKAQVDEIERYNPEINPETGDENMWRIYGLGIQGVGEAMIYRHYQIVPNLPESPDETVYGMDFGFNNEGTLIRVDYKDGKITTKEVWYEPGLTVSDVLEKLKENNISKRSYIFADSAEKEQIEEIHRAGYNIHPAVKDVYAGIMHIKSLPFQITEDSVNLINEVKYYSWKMDKNEKILDEPVKLNDHACDALRYACYSYHMNKKKKVKVPSRF